MSKNGCKYIPGDNWVICDICGFKTRSSKARYNSDGLLVCQKDWEPRHPQEYIRHRHEKIRPDKVRSESEDTYIYRSYGTGSVFDIFDSLPWGFGGSVRYRRITADDL